MDFALNQTEPLLLVMCTGNVCRSPMAEALLKYYLAKSGLCAEVISRGLAAPVGRPPHQFAVETASSHGIPLDIEKRAAGVTSAEMAIATAIFVMDGGHRREVQQRFPTATGKTFLMGQWQAQEIADPINAPLSAFEMAWRQIDVGTKVWVERLNEAGMLKRKCTA